MFRQITQLLGDASVTLKLALGFSLVLALSLVIAATGWQALAASLYRSQTLTVLAQLAVAGEELRADRIVYRTLDDANSFSRLSTSMEKIDSSLAELSSRLTAPKALQYLQEMARISATFKTTLKGVPALVEQRESAREQLKQNSVRTGDALAQLASDLPDQEDEKALDAVENLRQAIEQAEDSAQSPAWAASSLLGRTPMHMSTRSVGIFVPSSSTAVYSEPLSNAVTFRPSLKSIPASASSVSAYALISGSSGGNTCGASSTTVTAKPRCRRFSATSKPMNPAPTTKALFVPSPIFAKIASRSGIVQNWNTRSESVPGRSGTTGLEPVAIRRRS